MTLLRRLTLPLSMVACALAPPIHASETQLHVMLQGASASDMREQVQAQKGRLTHYLPIIDAVGAELTRAQLDAILETDKVGRYIDDLSVNPDAETPVEPAACDVGGALELDFAQDGFAWRLYNKGEEPVTLSSLDLTWPSELGRLENLSFAGKPVDAKHLDLQVAGSFNLALDSAETAPSSGESKLVARFSKKITGSHGSTQSAIEVTLAFAEGCDVATVPAYENNHEDFHFAGIMEADQLHLHDIRGQGITVAVLDSGLWEHKALLLNTRGNERVLARYDAISDNLVDEAFDESGHGTHLTSVLAHSGPTLHNGQPTGTFKGVAPDVSLLAVKAFNVEGQGDMLDIVRGIQWVVENREKYDIRVLNLSFASRPRWPYWLDPVNQAVMQAWAAGIVVVAAAGNEGPEPMTVGSPGNLPYIITVGAVTDSWTPDDRSDDYVPDFSSRGPTPSAHIKPDLVAPGGHMTGLTRPDSTLTRDYPEYMLRTGEFVMTGSSQAAALVSGLAALLLQLQPELTPDQVKCKLTSSAEPAINRDGLLAYSPFEQGHGYASVTRAITLGASDCGNNELDLAKDIAGEAHFEGPATVTEGGAVSLPGLETMVSPTPPASGPSDTRVWGVKAHVERLPDAQSSDPNAPFDWLSTYEMERARIKALREGNGG